MGCSLEHPADGGDESGVFIGDDQTDAIESASTESTSELGPERFGLGVTDRTAQHFPAAV